MIAPGVAVNTATANGVAQAPGGDAALVDAGPLTAWFAAGVAPFSMALAALVGNERGSGGRPSESSGLNEVAGFGTANGWDIAAGLGAMDHGAMDHRASVDSTGMTADSSGATIPDSAAAVLAAVLQWLQQQPTGATRDSGVTRIPDRQGDAGIATDSSRNPLTAAALSGSSNAAGAVLATAWNQMPDMSTPKLAPPSSGSGAENPADNTLPAAVSLLKTAPLTSDGTNPSFDLAASIRAATAVTEGTLTSGAAVHTIDFPVPVHDRHWPQAMAVQLLIMSDQKMQAATLRLSPEHLGPVEVRIDLQQSTVNVDFTAAHVETRNALEQALPQLRAILAGAGLSLGQASVQQHSRPGSQNSHATARTASEAADQPVPIVERVRALGMVDEYV